jgi:tetratricopeptide (TPR) repeat protein
MAGKLTLDPEDGEVQFILDVPFMGRRLEASLIELSVFLVNCLIPQLRAVLYQEGARPAAEQVASHEPGSLPKELRDLLEELARLSQEGGPETESKREELCLEVLRQVRQEEFPETWAITQYALGNLYLRRYEREGERQLVEAAEECYRQALEVYTREAFPYDWARVQSSLGTACQERSLGERAENLELAIAAYHAALEVYTREASPAGTIGSGAAIDAIIRALQAAFPFKLSLLYPRKLSKRLSSPFIVHIYPPEKGEEASARITKERRKWRWQLEEHVDDAELPTGLAVNIRISNSAIDFSGEVTKVLMEDQLNSLHFNGQPKETCAPGIMLPFYR